jgi:hypothetical protein
MPRICRLRKWSWDSLQQVQSCRHLPLLGITALLASCAAPPAPLPSPLSSDLPLPPPAPKFSLEELSAATQMAYREGFTVGRHYQRRIDLGRPAQAGLASGNTVQQAQTTTADVEVASNKLGQKVASPLTSNNLPAASRFSVTGTAQPDQ